MITKTCPCWPTTQIGGRITRILGDESGRTKVGKPWNKRVYELEPPTPYIKKIVFSVLNSDIDRLDLAVGDEVVLDVDIESREYNGRWYTSIVALDAAHHAITVNFAND